MDKKRQDTHRNLGLPTASGNVSTDASLSPMAEEEIQQEFERLVERMRSPEHRAATQKLIDMTPGDLRDFFKVIESKSERPSS